MTADIDLAEIARAKNFADPVGHYSRPDIFRLIVNFAPQPCVQEVASSGTADMARGDGIDEPPQIGEAEDTPSA